MKQHLKTICLLLVFASAQIPANAMPFYFDYTFSGGQFISGTMDGEVQQDGDTVAISQMLTLDYLGSSVDSSDYYMGLYSTLSQDFPDSNEPGIVSFSGLQMNFASCDFETCTLGLIMRNSDANAGAAGFGYDTSPAVTIILDPGFNPDAWNLSVIPTAVPEPSSLLLVLIGCVALMASKKYAQPELAEQLNKTLVR